MRASGRVVINEDIAIYTHWGSRQDDGTMMCSCGWTSEGPIEHFEIFFLAHAQVEMTNLVMDEAERHNDRREAAELRALESLHIDPSPTTQPRRPKRKRTQKSA